MVEVFYFQWDYKGGLAFAMANLVDHPEGQEFRFNI